MQAGPNAVDPYESLNRKVFKFNRAFDATFLKPPAKLYVNVLPAPVRAGVNNFYNNINMLPTIANDLLQAHGQDAIKDFWRLVINSTLGIGGIFDPASTMSLPAHSNDLGLTFAQWGDQKSPYIIIPFLGPSTIRDGMGLFLDCTLFTPYPYLGNAGWVFGVLGLRYVDLRSQMFDTERLMAEAIDPYTFIRDAYLQHRNYLIVGDKPDNGALYVEEQSGTDSKAPLVVEEPTDQTSTPVPANA